MNNFFTIILVLMSIIVSSCAKNEDNHKNMDSSYNDKENIDINDVSNDIENNDENEDLETIEAEEVIDQNDVKIIYPK